MPFVKRALINTQLHIKTIDRQRSPIAILRAIRSIRDARSVLQLSQADLGREIGRLLNVAPLSQSTIANAEAKRATLDRAYIDAIGRLLATWLARQLGRDQVGVKIAVNSPWHVTAWAKCEACGEWFEVRRAMQRGCGKCGRAR